MKRYHLLPQLTPKGTTYQMETLMGGTPEYKHMEKSWNNIIELMRLRWFRRFPLRLHEPWISWEVYADFNYTKYFLWASDDDFGANVVDRIMVEHPDHNIFYADPPPLDFKQPHGGIKLLLDREFSLPLHIFRDSTIDSQSAFLEFLSNLGEDEQVVAQFLVRPAYHSSTRGHFSRAQKKWVKNQSANKGERETFLKAIAEKENLPNAEVTVKLLAFAPSKERAYQLVDACARTLSYMNTRHLNRLKTRNWWRIIRPMFRMEFKRRLFPFRLRKNRMILSSAELSGLLRLPSIAGTAKFIRLRMQRPVPPMEIRKLAHSDQPTIYIGDNSRSIATFPIHFSLDQFHRHVAIIGGAQTGKTTLLFKLLSGLLEQRTEDNPIGCAVVDTKGDLVQKLLEWLPEHLHPHLNVIRFRDGEYPFNLYDVDFPMIQHGGHCTEILARANTDHWTPQLLDLLVSGSAVLGKTEQMSFRNLQRLLEDEDYYRSVRSRLQPEEEEDRNLMRIFDQFYAGDKKRVDWRKEFLLSPIMSKLRNLNSSGLSSMLNQGKNAIKWKKGIHEGHIQIFDLSGLSVSEKQLIGISVLFIYELLVLQRAYQIDQGRSLPTHPLVLDDPTPFLEQGAPDFLDLVNSMRRANMPILTTLPGIQEVLSEEKAEVIFRNFGTHFVYQMNNLTDAEYVCEQLSSKTFGLTPRDFHLINPRYCYMQSSINRNEVFHVETHLPEKNHHPNEVDELIRQSLQRARNR